MLYLLVKLKMKQQVATSTDMAVGTTKLTDYNTGITWLIIWREGRAKLTMCIRNSVAYVPCLEKRRIFIFFFVFSPPK